jgi:hypothetical protein
MATERKSLILRGQEDCPVRAKYIDRQLRVLGLRRAAWPKASGPHKRLEAGARFTLRLDAKGAA